MRGSIGTTSPISTLFNPFRRLRFALQKQETWPPYLGEGAMLECVMTTIRQQDFTVVPDALYRQDGFRRFFVGNSDASRMLAIKNGDAPGTICILEDNGQDFRSTVPQAAKIVKRITLGELIKDGHLSVLHTLELKRYPNTRLKQ